METPLHLNTSVAILLRVCRSCSGRSTIAREYSDDKRARRSSGKNGVTEIRGALALRLKRAQAGVTGYTQQSQDYS